MQREHVGGTPFAHRRWPQPGDRELRHIDKPKTGKARRAARTLACEPDRDRLNPRCYASSVQRISSRQNAVVKDYKDAARGASPDTLLLDGTHLIDEALRAGIRLRHVLVASELLEHAEIARLLQLFESRGVPVAAASAAVMDAASPVRSSSPVVALAARPAASTSPYDTVSPLVVIVCDMQNPGNVGAIIRVAEAAGASGVVVAGLSADPFGWKALRGSMGSALRLPVTLSSSAHDAVVEARQRDVHVIATVARGGVAPSDAPLARPTALLIGGEGLGLAPDIVAAADSLVSIPMQDPVESLNASVAAAVLLYEARRQRA